MRVRTFVALLVVIPTVLVGGGLFFTACGGSSSPPPPGAPYTLAGYPLYQQDDYFWCGPANVEAWEQWDTGHVDDQSTIFNWMVDNYGNITDTFANGVSPDAIAGGVSHFAFPTYAIVAYYAGGDEPRQGMADQRKAITSQRPVINIADGGFHAVTVVGGSWHQLSTLQPSDDTVLYNDPDYYDPQYHASLTVGYWLSTKANACGGGSSVPCLIQIEDSYVHNWATAELSEFDSQGGTYYGDPAPPEECQVHCEPFEASYGARPGMLALANAGNRLFDLFGFATLDAAGNRAHKPMPPGRAATGPRHEVYVPYPNATDSAHILENFRAGVQQTFMYKVRGLEALGAADGGAYAASIERIESVSGVPPYYLIVFTNAAGKPYALGAVSEVGWLIGAFPVEKLGGRLPVKSDQATALIERHVGRGQASNVRRIHVYSTFSSASSEFFPVVAADTPRGLMLVNHKNEVFVESPNGHDGAKLNGTATRFEKLR